MNESTAVTKTKAKPGASTAKATETKAAKAPAGRPRSAARKPKKAKPARIGFGAQPLEDGKAMERLYCSERQLPSPMGGSLAYMGARAEPDGTSTVLFECKTSTLRFELPMRNSTWRERRKVKEQVADGLEPLCPRAELGPALQRREDYWYCPRCNLKFGLAS